jgi:hypothetical protein
MSLGRVCATGIVITSVVAVFLLPALWRIMKRSNAALPGSTYVQQTRKLRVLVRPLVATGHVVFAKPKRFRWQLGEPPRTLEIGTATELTVAYPRLRQVQRYRYGGDIDPALRQVLDLLEIGFPTAH